MRCRGLEMSKSRYASDAGRGEGLGREVYQLSQPLPKGVSGSEVAWKPGWGKG